VSSVPPVALHIAWAKRTHGWHSENTDPLEWFLLGFDCDENMKISIEQGVGLGIEHVWARYDFPLS